MEMTADLAADPEDVLDALTPAQWYGILTGDEDGPLPPCCGNVSHLRDQIIGFARLPTPTGALRLARALADEDGDHLTDSLVPLFERLSGYLDATRPGWRTERLTTAEEMETFEAQMLISGRVGGGIPRWEPKPRDHWQAAVERAMRYMWLPAVGEDPGDAALDRLETGKRLLTAAGEAGAPGSVLLPLYQALQALARDMYATRAAQA